MEGGREGSGKEGGKGKGKGMRGEEGGICPPPLTQILGSAPDLVGFVRQIESHQL